jgi:Mrp family chromosome partitioning ATPase
MIHNVQNNGRKIRVRSSDRLRVHFLTLARRIAGWNVSDRGRGSLALGVTGVEPRSGCTTVAFNLAAALAAAGDGNVLFVECSFGRPNIGRRITRPASGLSDILEGTEAPVTCIHQTSIERLYFLGCGRCRLHDSVNLPFNMLHNLNMDLADSFEYIVYDLPAANITSTCFAIVPYLDAIVAVADANDVREDIVNAATRRCSELGTPVIGIVLNKA